MAHGLSDGEPLRFHITVHHVTAPNHIHIFIRLISSDCGTFSRHGTFTPQSWQSLCKRQTTAHPYRQQRMQFQYGLTPDSSTAPLPNFSPTSPLGHHRDYSKIPARQLQQTEWSTHPEMGRHLLQQQHSPPFWLIKFSSRSNWSTWLSDFQAITWRIYLFYTIPLLFLFWWICLPAKTSAWHFKDTLRIGTQRFLISNIQLLVLFKH